MAVCSLRRFLWPGSLPGLRPFTFVAHGPGGLWARPVHDGADESSTPPPHRSTKSYLCFNLWVRDGGYYLVTSRAGRGDPFEWGFRPSGLLLGTIAGGPEGSCSQVVNLRPLVLSHAQAGPEYVSPYTLTPTTGMVRPLPATTTLRGKGLSCSRVAA
jgi:hypothetical protein